MISKACQSMYMTLNTLVVPGSPGDVWPAREAFRDANTAFQVHLVSAGLGAMVFVGREGIHLHARCPVFVSPCENFHKWDGRTASAHIAAAGRAAAMPLVIHAAVSG
jgi:hypothetical protein